MTWDEYRDWCLTKREGPIECMALGLAGETGELVDEIKKQVYHKRATGKFKEEAGDLFFYYTMLLHDMGYSLDEVMRFNMAKLNERYPDGFRTGGGIR